jgi:hypothetical protein
VKEKTVITILATGMFLFAFWLSASGLSCGHLGFFDSQKILINDNMVIASAMKMPLLNLHSELVEECRSQPILVGMLILFITVSASAAGFVYHLLRSDEQF